MKIGDKIFVPTRGFLSRGQDDIQGGEATVSEIFDDGFISVKEIPVTRWGIEYLMENQEKWSKEYKGIKARPDPDDPKYNDGW